MAEASGIALQGLKVLLVRHGQSTNNVLMEHIYAQHGAKSAAAERAWLAGRSTDPPLTPEGQTEAEAFAAHYAPLLRDGGVRIFCSPFLRTCQTAAPLCAALGIVERDGGGGGGGGAMQQQHQQHQQHSCTLRADLCEVGGVYTDKGGERSGPGKCMSKSELAAAYPAYNSAALPAQGGWWSGDWENDAAAWARAVSVAAWLKSRALRDACGGDWVVLVTHGAFTDLLLKALLGLDTAPHQRATDNSSISGSGGDTGKGEDNVAKKKAKRKNEHFASGGFAFRNTATGTLLVQPDGTVRFIELGAVGHLQQRGKEGHGVQASSSAALLTQAAVVTAAAAAGLLLGSALGMRLRSDL